MSVPDRLPALALRDLVFFPGMVLPLLVGRPPSVSSLRAAEEASDKLLLLLAQKDPAATDPAPSELQQVGTVVRILQSTPLQDGTWRVVFEGIRRARVTGFLDDHEALHAEIRPLDYAGAADSATISSEFEALTRRVERAFREYVHRHPDLPPDIAPTLSDARSPERGIHLIGGHLILPPDEKQALLEEESLSGAYERLLRLLERELEILQIENDLDQEMHRRMEDDRRQHYLQEQLRAIQKELGTGTPEWEDLQTGITESSLPDLVRERAEREFGRLQRMNPASPEAAVIRSYLEWIVALPWMESTQDNPDLAHARNVLEDGHFGLEEVKDRILDHIAVLSLVGELKGPILCLVGPPGVGKTSLGRSIAHALNRKFVRVALGGVRDEAEIRGHRRTYVGSLPGRVIQGIRRAESCNPVFLLDEVDKLARDAHGDPSSALLEVLDPEQNRAFQDHYLELDFDLSQVLFIATANTLSGIPGPLRDRMEVIRIPGYLDTEKRSIARDFLIPEQLRRHGIDPDQVEVSTEVVDRIVEDYTRESGVRELNRLLARVARKLARRRVETTTASEGGSDARRSNGETAPPAPDEVGTSMPGDLIRVTVDDLEALLGPPRHLRTDRDGGVERIGIATGLAWTSVGGEILEVEVAVVPGSGAIQLTGTLGDVMKESAVAAVTYARSRARELGLRTHFHRDVDVHVHIPEGATPKDGPSAGVTIAAALISALTGTPTRDDVAMTGEITLRGRVLPVGGLKEKAVAALRHGIHHVVLPAGNASEVEALPGEVLDRVTFHPVERVDQMLHHALVSQPGTGVITGSAAGEIIGTSADAGTRLSQ